MGNMSQNLLIDCWGRGMMKCVNRVYGLNGIGHILATDLLINAFNFAQTAVLANTIRLILTDAIKPYLAETQKNGTHSCRLKTRDLIQYQNC